jgi:molecular chaperone DnaK (HSP70)
MRRYKGNFFVERILELITAQTVQMSDIKLMMMAGGFSASPYLMKRVRDTFIQYKVEEVISPPNPGSAVCQGAAALICQQERHHVRNHVKDIFDRLPETI